MSNEFGRTIRKRRREKGYTLNRFAKLAGISQSYLSLVERGLMKPPADDKVRQIADLLGMHRDDLMFLAKRLPEDVREVIADNPKDTTRMVRKYAENK